MMATEPEPGKDTRVLIVDPLHESAVEQLRRRFDVTIELGPSEERLCELIGEVDVLVMRSGVRLGARAITAARRLTLVARAGAGVDNIDLAAARSAGVRVFNVPGQSAGAVAEFTLGLVLAVTRRIALADAQVRENLWRKPALVGRELRGSTLGLVGLGAIGSSIAQLALAFGMQVLATVARASEERRAQLRRRHIELVPLHDALARADVLCLAVPLTEQSRNLIAAEELSRMAPGAYLVNVARGAIVNERDLYDALASGRLAGAALDVVVEPGAPNPLAQLENVIVTPHIAAMTEQSQERVGRTVVDSIVGALRGEPLANQLC
jgi:D-3-phosphoglycerate dehydrogenase / 2-oxoglutarate reductase